MADEIYKPTEMDWARLAAFIDGEGSILLSRFSTKNTAAQRKRMWIRVVVANTDFRLIGWLVQKFGGSVSTDRRADRNPNHCIAYKWHVSCRTAAEVIRGCQPYFIIKTEQARIALEFQATLGGPGKFVTEEVRQHRESLRQQMHSLKRVTPLFDGAPEVTVPEMKRGPRKSTVGDAAGENLTERIQ